MPEARGRRNEKLLLNEYGTSVWGDKKAKLGSEQHLVMALSVGALPGRALWRKELLGTGLGRWVLLLVGYP